MYTVPVTDVNHPFHKVNKAEKAVESFQEAIAKVESGEVTVPKSFLEGLKDDLQYWENELVKAQEEYWAEPLRLARMKGKL